MFFNVIIFPNFRFRAKIEAIVKKPGHADPDAPHDVASTRWWCNVGGKYTGREVASVTMRASTAVAATPDALTSMLGGSEGCASGSEMLSLTNGNSGSEATSSGAPSAPSMETLVGLISAKAKAKSKAKAKAKAKANPSHAAAATPAEAREQFRTWAIWISLFFVWGFASLILKFHVSKK